MLCDVSVWDRQGRSDWRRTSKNGKHNDDDDDGHESSGGEVYGVGGAISSGACFVAGAIARGGGAAGIASVGIVGSQREAVRS